MGRLTNRKTAAELKENAEKLRAAGIEPTISDLRYIKLAAYENRDEDFEKFRNSHNLNVYECDADKNTKCKQTSCYKCGGQCHLTFDLQFAKLDKNGNPIKG